MENVFYVYVLKNPKSGALYYGFSSNLRQRFESIKRCRSMPDGHWSTTKRI